MKRFMNFSHVLLVLFVIAFYSALAAGQAKTLQVGTPLETGMSEDIINEAVKLYEDKIARDEIRGCVLFAARKGQIVLHKAMGWMDLENTIPFKKNTMFRMASDIKPVVATAINILLERGKLNLDDNVREYLPSFDNYKSGFVKVRHLLTHKAGFQLQIFIKPFMEPTPEHPDAPTLLLEVARLGVRGPDFIPGTAFRYSNAGYNILGGLIETVSGTSLEDFLKEHIYEPLEMNDSYNFEVEGHLDGKLKRMPVFCYKDANKWVTAWKPGDPPTSPFPRGSGGLISTAMDYAKFCQMFLNGGIYNNKRILEESTVKRMTQSQTRHVHSDEERANLEMNYYGYGWIVNPAKGIYMHGGSDGTYVFINPEKELICLALTQNCFFEGDPVFEFYDLIEASVYK